MQKLSITGNGPLRGEIAIDGAKNAALPILAASLLTSQPLSLSQLPNMIDISTMLELLEELGAKVETDKGITRIACPDDAHACVPLEHARAMRASILLLGPLLARFGEAELPLPGGCAIGSRPVNLHLEGLRAMGAEIDTRDGYIHARASRLKGADLSFETISVTGTENLMMAATLAAGQTVIRNAAREPEIGNLADCLNAMGAKISGAGSSTIIIDGVEKLHGAEHKIIPDRIETGTYLVAAAATRGKISTHHACPSDLKAVLEHLHRTGATVLTGGDWITIDMKGRRPTAVDVVTGPHPAFPTDMQAQFVALNAIATGRASVQETIFENRFMHVTELKRMGANISLDGETAHITGVERLSAANVTATDLRASASLVIAALCADGTTTIDDIYHLDRGYANLEQKLTQLGAIVSRSGILNHVCEA